MGQANRGHAEMCERINEVDHCPINPFCEHNQKPPDPRAEMKNHNRSESNKCKQRHQHSDENVQEYRSKRKTVKVDDEQRQHSNLNAGRHDDRGQRIAQESLNVPSFEFGRNWSLEESIADVRARHIRAPLSIMPE